MTTNEGWSFKDRSFLLAISLSLAWHCFWFFLVQVTVAPSRSFVQARPKVVALGPLLEGTIFKTLVDTKPQTSETFYRRLSDFSSVLEPPVQMAQRHEPGEVVSLPFGGKMDRALRHILGGDKLTPNDELTHRLIKKRSTRLLGTSQE